MSVQWSGLEELKRELMQNSNEMASAAHELANTYAERAKEAIQAEYPDESTGTGNLKRGVRVKRSAGAGWSIYATVKSTAPHAHLYEYGTAERFTKNGAARGRMFVSKSKRMVPLSGTVEASSISGNQAIPVVGRVASRMRRAYYDDLVTTVERITGADVKGRL